MKTKPAFRSRGILGTGSALFTIIGTVSAVIAWWDTIPQELKDETMFFITVQLVQFIQVLIGLIGRWKAEVPIKGFLKTPSE